MKREELLKQLRKETREASIAYYNYIYTDREYLEGTKLHLREIYFLMTVGEKGNISMGEIAAELNVSQGAATQIASRLLKKKLIMKLIEREDRRRVQIVLTAEGKRVFEEYVAYNQKRGEEIDACFEEFSEEDIQKIMRYEMLVKDICNGKIARKSIK